MKTVKFGSIAQFRNGINYKANETGNSIKVLGVGDFQRKTYLDLFETLKEINLNTSVNKDDLLMDGDLVFVRSNGNKDLVGRCLTVYPGNQPITFSGFTIRARLVSKKFLPEYISLLLQNGVLKKALRKEGAGTNISNLNQQILSSLSIPELMLEDQQKILDTISAFDTLIQKTERLIEVKKENLNALQLELINKAIKSGKKYPLSKFLSESRVLDTENDPDKRITVRLWLKGVEKRQLRGTEAEGATVYYIRKKDQLIYGKQNAHRGAFGIIPQKLDGFASSQDLPAFDIFGIDPEWLYYCIANDPFLKKLENYTNGSGSKRLHQSDLLRFKIPIPENTIQVKFSQLLNYLMSETKILERQLRLLKKEKNIILTKLLDINSKRKEAPNG